MDFDSILTSLTKLTLTKLTESPKNAQFQVNRLPLRLRSMPWLPFKSKN